MKENKGNRVGKGKVLQRKGRGGEGRGGVVCRASPRGKRDLEIFLFSVDLRTVSRNIIQILNWKRYLAIVNACGSFHRGAPRVKPAPATESLLARCAADTRNSPPKLFLPFLPSSNRVKSIEYFDLSHIFHLVSILLEISISIFLFREIFSDL